MKRCRRFRTRAALLAAAFVAGNAAYAGYGGLVVTPNALSFPVQPIQTISDPQIVTVDVSTPGASLNLTGISVTAPFVRAGGTCPSSGPATAPCTLEIVFAPPDLNEFAGTLTVNATVDAVPATRLVNLGGSSTTNSDLGFSPGDVQVSPGSISVGQSLMLNVEPRNSGPSAASSATVTIQIPKQLGAQPVGSNSNWLCAQGAQIITCDLLFPLQSRGVPISLGALPPIALTGLAPASPANLVVSIASYGFDGNSANDTVVVPVFIGAAGSMADLQPDFQIFPDPVPLGDVYFVEGVVRNVGSDTAAGGVQLRLSGMPGLVFDGFFGSGWSCAPSGADVLCSTTAPILAGDETLFLSVSLQAPNMTTNQAIQVENQTPDANSGNDLQALNVRIANNDFVLAGTANPLNGVVPFPIEVQLLPTVVDFSSGKVPNVYEITSTLPTGVLYSAGPAGGIGQWSCNAPGGSSINCTLVESPRRGAPVVLPALNLTLNKSSAGASSVQFNLVGDSGVPDSDPSNNSVKFDLQGSTPDVDLRIVKTASAPNVTPGQVFDYVLGVSSSSSSGLTATAVTVEDTLPAGLSLQGVSFGSGTGTWNCSTGTIVICTLASGLSPGASAPDIILAVRYDLPEPPAGGQLSNSATVSSMEMEAAPADNSSSVTVNVRPASNLQLRKSASRSSLSVGESVQFTLQVLNPGNVDATGLVVLDAVPAAFAVTAVASDDFACSRVENNIDCRRSQFDGGATGQIVITADALTVGTHVNRANITSNQARTPINASATVQVLAGAGADLVVDKRASVGTVTTGQSFSYALVVRNEGAADAQGVVLDDPLPTGVSLLSIDAGNAVCTGTTAVRCTLGSPLPPMQSFTVQLNVRADLQVDSGCQTIVNTATASSSSADSNPGNNTGTGTVSICAPGAGLLYELEVAATPLSAVSGAQSFAVMLRNNGPAGYPGGTLEIDFGTTNLRLESFLSCNSDAASAVCMLPAIAAGQSLSGSLQVRTTAVAPAAGQIRLHAPAVDPGDANLANNSVVIALSAPGGGGDGGPLRADLALSARALSATALAGDNANFEFVVNNLGPAASSGVVLLLDLPAGSALGNAQGNAVTCTTNGLQVRCVAAEDLLRDGSLLVNLALRLPTLVGDAVVHGSVSATTQDSVPGNNTATALTRVRLENVTEATAVLNTCAGNDQIAQISVDALARACADPNSPLQPLCRQLLSAEGAQACGVVREVLSEIAPKDVLAQSLMLRDFANTQFFNVDARLNELRGGSGGFSLSGLNVRSGRTALSLGTVRDLLRAAQGDTEGETEYDADLVTPWGFFMNGTISSGEQDLNTERYRVKADFESRGITAGVDYRFKPNLVGGLAIGFAKFDTDVSDLSQMDTRALSFTAYGSWYPVDRLYVDARLSLGRASFDLNRRIDFSIGGDTVSLAALGSTDADQLTFAASIGHHYNLAGWNVTPNLAFRYVSSDVDAFTETGAGMFNVAYGDQTVDSSQIALGLQFGRAFSISSGVISPQFDFNLNRDFSDDDLVLEARLAGDGGQGVFQLREQDPDESYGSVGLGFVYVTANGKQAYLSYRRNVAQTGLDRATLNFGVRFEF